MCFFQVARQRRTARAPRSAQSRCCPWEAAPTRQASRQAESATLAAGSCRQRCLPQSAAEPPLSQRRRRALEVIVQRASARFRIPRGVSGLEGFLAIPLRGLAIHLPVARWAFPDSPRCLWTRRVFDDFLPGSRDSLSASRVGVSRSPARSLDSSGVSRFPLGSRESSAS